MKEYIRVHNEKEWNEAIEYFNKKHNESCSLGAYNSKYITISYDSRLEYGESIAWLLNRNYTEVKLKSSAPMSLKGLPVSDLSELLDAGKLEIKRRIFGDFSYDTQEETKPSTTCTCTLEQIMREGCICGAVKRYQQ